MRRTTGTVDRGGWRLAYADEGPPDAPTVILLHSLGLDRSSWRAQRDRLAGRWRVVRVDTRGHGASEAPPPPYRVADLAGDVLAVADHLAIDRFHLVGISLGGLTALWTAIDQPQRLSTATLANTGAKLGDAAAWDARIAAVRDAGLAGIADTVVARFFSSAVARRRPDLVADARARLLACDPAGYVGCCAALRDADLRGQLGSVSLPVLVIGADGDLATPVALAEHLDAHLPDSTLTILPAAGHVSNLEAPDAFSRSLDAFLGRHRG